MKNRILTVLLAVCLVFALGTVSALADGEGTTKLPAADDGVITLNGNVEIEITELSDELQSQLSASNNKLEINLAGYTLTITNPNKGKVGVQIEQNANITIRNGKIVAQQQYDGGHSLFVPKSGVSFTLDDVTVETNGTGIYAAGSATAVNVNNSTINADGYAIGTNASADESGKPIYSFNVNINVSESTLNAPIGALINVPGSLDISNSIINAQYQGVIARGGSTTINNTEISLSSVTDADEYKKYESQDWGTGNAVPMGGIVVGNRYNSYNYPASCTVSGSTSVTVPGGTNAVYAYQMSDTTNRKVDLAIKNGTFNADVVIAGDTGVTPYVSISGGKFTNADDLDDYLDDGYIFDKNGSVEISDDAVAQVGDTVYTNLQDAIDVAQNGSDKTVEILKDFDVDLTNGTHKNGIYTITGNITIDGNNRTIKATGTPNGDVHVFVVSGSANAKIIDLNINGNGIAHYGIQASGSSAKLELDDVEAYACEAYGVFSNNGATVNAANLRTHGNEWGGVNVDHGSTFTMKSGYLADRFSVVVDGGTTTKNNVVNLTGGTYNNIQIKTEQSDVNISGGTYNDIVGGNATDTDRYILNGTEADVTGGTFEENVNRFARVDYVVVGSDYSYFGTLNKALALLA